jgi:hypothetical protein
MIDLSKHIEDISDDFQSTFTQTGPNTLVNMLRGPEEFEQVRNIIQKYYEADVEFIKTNELGNDPYDIYLIMITDKLSDKKPVETNFPS